MEFVKIFEDFYSSFSQLVSKCSDSAAIADAEETVRVRNPEFDCNNLTPHSAHLVLDLVEPVITSVTYFKRSKIREGTMALISTLYNEYYDMLVKHDALDEVEHVYDLLKK